MSSLIREDFEQEAKKQGLSIVNEDIKRGDFYLAGRNTGIHLFIAKEIVNGYIIPDGIIWYPYDLHECHKVI